MTTLLGLVVEMPTLDLSAGTWAAVGATCWYVAAAAYLRLSGRGQKLADVADNPVSGRLNVLGLWVASPVVFPLAGLAIALAPKRKEPTLFDLVEKTAPVKVDVDGRGTPAVSDAPARITNRIDQLNYKIGDLDATVGRNCEAISKLIDTVTTLNKLTSGLGAASSTPITFAGPVYHVATEATKGVPPPYVAVSGNSVGFGIGPAIIYVGAVANLVGVGTCQKSVVTKIVYDDTVGRRDAQVMLRVIGDDQREWSARAKDLCVWKEGA